MLDHIEASVRFLISAFISVARQVVTPRRRPVPPSSLRAVVRENRTCELNRYG